MNQTLKPLEILVCDDGSSDNTAEVVQEISRKDSRVKWITGGRAGRPAVPRNRGIRASAGEWIAFLDSDDEWRSDKLEKQLALVKQSKCRAVCSNAVRMIPGRGSSGNVLSLSDQRISFSDLLNVNQIVCSSAVIHRSLIVDILGFPESRHLKALEDYALWLRVATKTDFAYVDEPLVLYRDEPVSSIRAESLSPMRQTRIVTWNFTTWALAHDLARLPKYGALTLAHLVKQIGKRHVGLCRSIQRKLTTLIMHASRRVRAPRK